MDKPVYHAKVGTSGLRRGREFRVYSAWSGTAELLKVGATSDHRNDVSRRLTFLRRETGIKDWHLDAVSTGRTEREQAMVSEALLRLHLLQYAGRTVAGHPTEFFYWTPPEMRESTKRLVEIAASPWPPGQRHPILLAVYVERHTGLAMRESLLADLFLVVGYRHLLCPLCRLHLGGETCRIARHRFLTGPRTSRPQVPVEMT